MYVAAIFMMHAGAPLLRGSVYELQPQKSNRKLTGFIQPKRSKQRHNKLTYVYKIN
jgi:hypothetical protein